MPKPTRRKRPKGTTSDPNARELALLAHFLESASSFRLGLAYCDGVATRDAMLARLESLVADRPVFVTRLDLGEYPGEESLLTRLREHLRDHPAPEGKNPAVMVVGLEALLDYRGVAQGRFSPQPILRNANLQRDAYPRLVPAAVVLWLLPTASVLLANQAPDLWHWRSGTFHFSAPPAARRVRENHHVIIPLLNADNLEARDQGGRIALLHDLLIELDAEEDRDSSGHLARRAGLLLALGVARKNVGQYTGALEYFRESAELFRRIGDRNKEGAALGNSGAVHNDLGEPARAIGYLERQLAIARELGDRHAERIALGNLGTVYRDLGQLERAIDYFGQGLAIARALGDRRGEGFALGNLGAVYDALGQRKKALQLLQEAITILREADLDKEQAFFARTLERLWAGA